MGQILSSALALVVLLPLSAPARAAEPGGGRDPDGGAVTAALDADVVIPVSSEVPAVSFGGALRIGWRAKVGPLFAQPELVFGLQQLPSGGGSVTQIRGMAGGRLGMRGLLQPQAIAHLGYGGSPDQAGLVYDAGIALDLHFVRVCAGLHLTWNGTVDALHPANWVDVGPNLTILI